MNSRSSELFTRAQERIPGGVNSPVRAFRNVGSAPFFVARAEGAKIWDVDGNEYIDYIGSWGPAILGHAPKIIVDAVREAATRGLSFGIPNPLEVEMAELICDWMPSIEKVRMVNSGTEATMSCIRLGRAFTRRDKIIKFDGCYHGHADSLLVKAGSGALTHGRPDSAGLPQAFVDLTISLPFNDANRVRKCFAQNKAQIAAVIVEPVPANSGLYFPTDNFLSVLREECTRNGALLIFDEVITGFRVARGGAQEIYGVKSDLTALGKIIGGGFPVGAFGGRAEIMDQLSPDGPVYQAGTLSGNPLGMAAGLAQLRELERIDGWKLLDDLGAQFEKLARDAIKFATANPCRGGQAKINITFHRLGSMFCLFFASGPIIDLAGARRSDLKMFTRFFHACLKRGVCFAPSQFETGFISTSHTQHDIEATGAAVREALAEL
ncbi:MAG: glutamate-1-semialdehyde-2,1-aminomutase [Verrucomicrobia bacterium]|nr:MAG: glutamate-1-semialdehyde-2,1-aminomutase [Verrucomicrobiota bacterium]PYJ31766.1 MAG: glutamate-1-semialdehyde-2,1-aminomutase [Verrucomicrobiota bacterium]